MKSNTDTTALAALTTPASTYEAPQAITRPANAKLPHKLEPHPLAINLEGLKASASDLRRELDNQTVRLADLARLTEEKAVLVESIDSEVISYVEGSASLAVLDQKLDVLGWTTNKRGVSAVVEFHNLRQCALDLKMSVIEAIDAASSAVVTKRQQEVAGLIAGWDGTTPAPSPLAVSLIAAACPTVRKLEALRITLEAVKMDLGLATLATTLEPILDLLAGISVPPARPALWGGHTARGLTAVMGWNGSDPWLETLAVFDRISDSNNFYNEFRGKSGYCGYKQVVLLDEAHPYHSRRFESEHYIGQDLMQNAEMARVHAHTDGTTPRFFDDVKTWLAV
jgi:hypothetical protein